MTHLKRQLFIGILPIACVVGLAACGSTDDPPAQDAGPSIDGSITPDAEPDFDAEVPDVCGDGALGTTETCDDGDTDDGDGCSADCQTVESGYECAGEPSLCAPVCGDGQIIAPEECDDSNASNADGCSDACIIEDGFSCPTEGQPCIALNGSCDLPFDLALVDNAGVLEGTVNGDTTSGTNDVPTAICDGGSVGEAADLVYAFVLPDTRDVTITATFATDGFFRVLGVPCDPSTGVQGEAGFGDACANQDGAAADETLELHSLAAGTYYIAVDGVADTDVGAFSITLAAGATTCGDGVTDATEECDDMNVVDGDGCTGCLLDPQTNCTGSPSVCTSSCQDGIVDTDLLEQCDDGNAVDGDRCSAGCQLEFDVLDAEPNDTIADAQTVVAGQIVVGSAPAGDFDVYELVLAAESWVTLEGYTTVDGDDTNYNGSGQLGPVPDCNISGGGFPLDPDLHLFADTGDVSDVSTALISDDFAGTGICPFIGVNVDGNATLLAPGTYYVRVDNFNDTRNLVQYALDVRVDLPLALDDTCDDQYDLCSVSAFLGCDPGTLLCAELCGNGVIDASEECDDGNLVNDDRCSDTCILNADVVDVVDNDTFATAQPLSSGQIARGDVTPGSDPFDLYTFTLTETSWIALETYTSVDGTDDYNGQGFDLTLDCGNDTLLDIFDAAGDPADNTTAIAVDDDDGDGACSYLSPERDRGTALLQPGTYFIKVSEFGENAAIPLYALDFQVLSALDAGDACDTDIDLCQAPLGCGESTDTCSLVAPEPIDRANVERFDDFDLQNTALTFAPSGGSFGVIASPATAFPDTPGAGTVGSTALTLGDDDSVELPFGFAFPFFGVDESSVFIGSNGYLTFGVGSTVRDESITEHFALPRIAFFFDDLAPNQGGTITADEFADRVTITFSEVPHFNQSDTVNAQIQLFDTGEIVITYLAVTELDSLVGISAGDDLGNPPVEIDFSAQIPSTPVAGDLVINELMSNPGAIADTNCDGNSSSTQDEFVELVNVSGVPLDLTGLTVADGAQVRHTFGPIILAHGQAIVIYGGGSSNCPDVLGVLVSTGTLGLNNGGDSVTLGTGDSVSYASSTQGVSSTRFDELTGTEFVDHNAIDGVANFSPGFRITGEAF